MWDNRAEEEKINMGLTSLLQKVIPTLTFIRCKGTAVVLQLGEHWKPERVRNQIWSSMLEMIAGK